MMPRKKHSHSSVPDERFESEWTKLRQSFDRLLAFIKSGFRKPENQQEWIQQNMLAYTVVYNLCTKHEGAKTGVNCAQVLYHRLQEMIQKHLKESVTDQVNGKKGEVLLSQVYRDWEAHRLMVKWGKFMFRYLDDYYTKNPNIDVLTIMMLKCFQTAVYENIKNELRDVILQTIELEREGNVVNREVLKSAVSLFIDMGMNSLVVYEQDFEEPLMRQTAAYYRREATAWFGADGGQFTYLKKAENRIAEEGRRADLIFAPSTKRPLLRQLEKELLEEHKARCMHDPDAGCAQLLSSGKHDELGRMYRLFNKVPDGLDLMAQIVREYIEKEGKDINAKFSAGGQGAASEGESAGQTYVRGCLDLHDKYTELFRAYFDNHEIYNKARKSAFETFLNPQQSDPWTLKQKTKEGHETVTSSELLSTYVDGIMKKEMESEQQLDEVLDKCVALFTYIHDKDLFQQFYMKQMSKRLLQNKNERLLDQERQMISKLKMKMGNAYTSKLEGMLTDQAAADNQYKSFRDYLQDKGEKLPLDFTPLVLTTGFWPAFKHDTLNPPPDMATCLTQFGRYYDKTTQSRKLTWIHSLGHATVMRKWAKGPREMSVSTYQACVMLLFNDRPQVFARDAEEVLQLPQEEIKRTIHSLAYGKFPVIQRADGNKQSRKIEPTDAFVVNEDFHTNSRKFKIPAVVKQERSEVIDTNQEQRRHVIEACVVRIMKSRRTLSHPELIAETIKQLTHLFQPEPKVIKKRIEDLIQRQYLERDEEDRNQYRYLA
eukprot:TRINITY_DN11083_c0_g1_i1.p1 TRINITY_DN11083_c0_g1~~TRINITY_DN11083_c0_g1_i1.p1  ORF type:complete len:813 (+),score=370.42 TRINITY_DN11083_c0_g1_i1:131-2440(+)